MITMNTDWIQDGKLPLCEITGEERRVIETPDMLGSLLCSGSSEDSGALGRGRVLVASGDEKKEEGSGNSRRDTVS